MSNDAAILTGKIHGRTIELDQAPGLPDGAAVSVTVSPTLPPGQNLRRAFGAWAEASDELDRFLDNVRRDRKQDRPVPGV
jgi:hypothetical protein